MKIETSAVLVAAWEFCKGVAPGALGAMVAVLFDKTATFTHRVIQFIVGIVVSYYVGAAIHEIFEFGPMVNQGISFTVGMVAYQSVPSFTKSASETAGSIPKDLWAWVKGLLPGKKKP